MYVTEQRQLAFREMLEAITSIDRSAGRLALEKVHPQTAADLEQARELLERSRVREGAPIPEPAALSV